MLGIAALAQLALCEFPTAIGAGALTGLAWRRWYAQQTGLEGLLNQNPDPELTRQLIAHMLRGDQAYQPWWADDDDEEEIMAILFASIH